MITQLKQHYLWQIYVIWGFFFKVRKRFKFFYTHQIFKTISRFYIRL
jgi:hypothetical protein